LTGFGNNFTIVLSAAGFDLNAVDFTNQLNGALDAAVHLQNCGPDTGICQPGLVGTNSLAVGERPIPEPASLAIFGTALAGLGLLRRRRKTRV
jgi:PEP-CTERM motif-containing protein